MTERDEMIARAKEATRNGTLPDHTSIFEDFADFAASEVARERERIARELADGIDTYDLTGTLVAIRRLYGQLNPIKEDE